MPLLFHGSEAMTLGVELELQIIDSKTKDLAPGSPKIFEKEVRRDMEKQIGTIEEIGKDLGFEFASAGSHPFARYSDRIPYPAERYTYLIDRNKWMARRLMIFGVHVHVGMPDAHHAMAMNNAMMPYLPHLLALSASSPYWQGKETGLASSRVTIFEALPTGGHPCTFQTWNEFETFYDSMIASKSITSIKDIWWDIRPHPDLGTVEIRVCDGLATLRETVALVALVQCLYSWFDRRFREGERFSPPSYWILRENKWKASRYGVEAEIILDSTGKTNLLRNELETLIQKLEPISESLGCPEELSDISRMLHYGLGYERQQRVYDKEGTFLAVTESIVQEFKRREPLFWE
ncbi:MAG: YbdK family carboxylate-amine ligase [Ignavibacteriales bacterium]|nr:YbdK family carboxylate-amine ligase [Ignavibacteriales bacterium]